MNMYYINELKGLGRAGHDISLPQPSNWWGLHPTLPLSLWKKRSTRFTGFLGPSQAVCPQKRAPMTDLISIIWWDCCFSFPCLYGLSIYLLPHDSTYHPGVCAISCAFIVGLQAPWSRGGPRYNHTGILDFGPLINHNKNYGFALEIHIKIQCHPQNLQ